MRPKTNAEDPALYESLASAEELHHQHSIGYGPSNQKQQQRVVSIQARKGTRSPPGMGITRSEEVKGMVMSADIAGAPAIATGYSASAAIAIGPLITAIRPQPIAQNAEPANAHVLRSRV